MKRHKANEPWRAMRANHLMAYPDCRICGDENDPCVHHLRYRGRRGMSEVPGDLMTLCRAHHDHLHKTYVRGTSLVDHTLTYVRDHSPQ